MAQMKASPRIEAAPTFAILSTSELLIDFDSVSPPEAILEAARLDAGQLVK